ncbi:peptide-binding protein [Dissulfurispira thermophila]|uniref:Peptide-binding protein n=2 Tax=root TaxID=1 RepID=A0A7G1GZF0_9BACT|nr:peptide-binding protein [Dissulfurispira thermophila]BCB95286.1 peptide-binding protein [Dissulfurispira thermophila]
MNISHILNHFFVFLFFIFAFIECPNLYATQPPDYAYGDAIVEGTIGEPSTLIPMLAGDSASHNVAGMIFNGIVKYNTDLKVIGDLAESWTISPDGMVITFRLRKGVRWADGVEFTAGDVLFGFKTIIDEKTPTPYKEDYLQVKKFEVLDKYTFRVTYKKPFAPALTSWGNLIVLPRHLLEGKDITKTDFGRNPIGTGPYKLKKWVSGQEVVLDSNKDYFQGRPYIDRYIYRVIPDTATMFLELQAGGIDIMGLTPIQYTKQTNTNFFKANFQKFRYPIFSYTYLGFNLKHPWFKDKRVRQAIAYAIDKNEIIDVVLFGLGSPATGPYVPNTWPYNPNVKKYEFNPEKARELLKEAGWKDTDGDGIVEKDGRPFKFTILTNMGNRQRINTATIIQYRLAKIGIKVDIRLLEWSTFINEFIDKRRFEAVLLGWSIGLDPDQYDIWHSSKTRPKEFNFVSYANPLVDELLEKGRRTFDIEQRKKAYYKIQEILADELPYIFLYVPDAIPIVHARIKGIKPSPIGISYNLHEWYVPKRLQRYSIEP